MAFQSIGPSGARKTLSLLGIGFSVLFILLSHGLDAVAESGDSVGKPTPDGSRQWRPGDAFLEVSHIVGGQYGPWGVLYEGKPQVKWNLFSSDDHIVLQKGNVGVGAVFGVNPAFVYYGPTITIAPLTILKIEFQFTHVILGFWKPRYGILDYNELGQFEDYSFAYRDKHGDGIGRAENRAYSFFIKPSLAMKFKSFVALYRGVYMYFKPGDFEGLYYNYIAGIILSHKSWCLTHDIMLLVEFLSGESSGHIVRAGLDNHLITVIGDGAASPLVTAYQWKIGPMAAWTFARSVANGVVQDPTLLVQFHFYGHDAIADARAKRIIGATLALIFNTDWYPD